MHFSHLQKHNANGAPFKVTYFYIFGILDNRIQPKCINTKGMLINEINISMFKPPDKAKMFVDMYTLNEKTALRE